MFRFREPVRIASQNYDLYYIFLIYSGQRIKIDSNTANILETLRQKQLFTKNEYLNIVSKYSYQHIEKYSNIFNEMVRLGIIYEQHG